MEEWRKETEKWLNRLFNQQTILITNDIFEK
jgi:hypothetical protein